MKNSVAHFAQVLALVVVSSFSTQHVNYQILLMLVHSTLCMTLDNSIHVENVYMWLQL